MSQLMTVEMQFESRDEVVAVLDHFGLKYAEEKGELSLNGYRGVSSKRKMDIVVKKEDLGFHAYSDVGFFEENGSWHMVCDSDDGIEMQIRNIHCYKKTIEAASAARRKVEVRGTIPKKLSRNKQVKEIVLSIQA